MSLRGHHKKVSEARSLSVHPVPSTVMKVNATPSAVPHLGKLDLES